MHTMDGEKVWMALLHLDGVASEWFYALDRDNNNLTWPCFVDFLNLHFGPPIRSNPLAEVKDLHRTGTVNDYRWQFQLHLCQCDDLSTKQQINLFTVGLGEPLKTWSSSRRSICKPVNLQTVLRLARAFKVRNTAAVEAVIESERALVPRSSYLSFTSNPKPVTTTASSAVLASVAVSTLVVS